MSDASRSSSPPSWRWRGAVLVATGLPLVLGFELSALANRLVFALWALISAAVLLVLLRRSWGLPTRALAARLLGTTTLVLALLAALLWRHAEVVDLGARAFAPNARFPLQATPVAALSAAIGLVTLVLWLLERRPERRELT